MPLNQRSPTRASWTYHLVHLIIQLMIKVFYGTVVVENAHLIPKHGKGCLLCPNHSNSQTDAAVLMYSLFLTNRHVVRFVAKDTLVYQKGFSGWLTRSIRAIPVKRKRDHEGSEVNNSDAMLKVLEALEQGDAVCFFPEGLSRFHPSLSELKTGAVRIISDVLTQNRSDPNFEVYIQTCTMTYTRRQYFRSDVLVKFNPPLRFTPATHPELIAPKYEDVCKWTDKVRDQLSSGVLDATSWDLIETSKLAARIYAPLGTNMTLGDYVRLSKRFLESFNKAVAQPKDGTLPDRKLELVENLKSYNDSLLRLGVSDHRILHPVSSLGTLLRVIIRLSWAAFLLCIAAPGLILWIPIFVCTSYMAKRVKTSKKLAIDSWDEIAEFKIFSGLAMGFVIWLVASLATISISLFSFLIVPTVMWFSLRWLEDAVAALRSFRELVNFLQVNEQQLHQISRQRHELQVLVAEHAVRELGLPGKPDGLILSEVGGGDKGHVKGNWDACLKYFSPLRRRKRYWDETLRLGFGVDYPPLKDSK